MNEFLQSSLEGEQVEGGVVSIEADDPAAVGAIELVKYDAACRALAEARSVDEVKDVRDAAMAMQPQLR